MKQKTDTDILIIGAGASGLAAACAAASAGVSVTAVDGNDRPGRKLSVTGNGRCNLTNRFCGPEDYNEDAVPFVRRVFDRFGFEDTIRFFKKNGLLIREEQEGRCYPYAGQASAVTSLLVRKAETRRVSFHLSDAVTQCTVEEGFFLADLASGQQLTARALILATGGRAGLSFGSTGDGYGFAKGFGHTLSPPRPALAGCESDDPVLSGLKGRARARVTLYEDGREKAAESGEVQFTGSGISGICVMNLTRYMNLARPVQKKKKKNRIPASGGYGTCPEEHHEYVIEIDFLPEYSEEELRELLRRSGDMVPPGEALSWLINDRIALAAASLSDGRPDRAAVILKHFPVHIRQTRGWKEAQVTRGGILLSEIRPETMASRLVPGLFFCGEVTDVDGPCGGYNLQWAWSSGYLSGISAAEYVRDA